MDAHAEYASGSEPGGAEPGGAEPGGAEPGGGDLRQRPPGPAALRRFARVAGLLGVMWGLTSCGHGVESPDPPTESSDEPPPAAPPAELASAASLGDAARGHRLFERFECHRCHDGTGLAPPPLERRCVGCHRDIHEGRAPVSASQAREWDARIHSLPDAPDLGGASRLRADWIEAYLLRPRDLRPHLEATMPGLAMDERDARDLAAALTVGAEAEPATEAGRRPPLEGDAARGERALKSRPCGACHQLGGRPLTSAGAPPLEGDAFVRAWRLAPDLAFAAARMRPAALTRWLRDPASVHPRTLMPPTGLDAQEVADVEAFLRSRATEPPPAPLLDRLPLLERPVSYRELDEALFRHLCRHCHSNPSLALGDGGPGNSGGFGFPGRGLDLSSEAGLRSGALTTGGRRRSVFREVEIRGDRMPWIVAAVRARQHEEAGALPAAVRGMPLGLPAVTPEQLQLLESYVAQRRAR